jgi:hypothetical protein
VKSNTTLEEVPLFITDAAVPGDPVVTVPTVIVAAVPVFPFGKVKFKIALEELPELVTDAATPVSPVVTVPI